ncbi:hypothetical protein OsI_04362 [Oryza sativa Indica Group]|uniref:Uncharacterized protein n=2 Tax=Oryza TaxID=4527 RepID=A0A0E0FVJ0_ORYNI|nr:hypothetical protein OsI_04362 [Oryza sativa Indica Group]
MGKISAPWGVGEDLASGSVRGGGGSRRGRPRGQRWTAVTTADGEDLVSGGGGWGRRRLRPQRMGKLRRWLGKTSPPVQCAEAAAVECAVAAEGDDDARSEPRIERVMRRNLRPAFAPGEGESCGGEGWTVQITSDLRMDGRDVNN